MTKLEAASLVAILVNAFPSVKFTEENAEVYEQHILNLPAVDTQKAIEELIYSCKYLPSVAEIRFEVTRAARERARLAYEERTCAALRLGDGSDGRTIGPKPESWKATLDDMLAAAERYRNMAAAWYSARGKQTPPDPGAAFDKIASDGAGGKDVAERLRKTVLPGGFDDLERRFP